MTIPHHTVMCVVDGAVLCLRHTGSKLIWTPPEIPCRIAGDGTKPSLTTLKRESTIPFMTTRECHNLPSHESRSTTYMGKRMGYFIQFNPNIYTVKYLFNG